MYSYFYFLLFLFLSTHSWLFFLFERYCIWKIACRNYLRSEIMLFSFWNLCWNSVGVTEHPVFDSSLLYSHLWWFNPISWLEKLCLEEIPMYTCNLHFRLELQMHVSFMTSPLECLISISNLTCPKPSFDLFTLTPK